MTAMNLTIPNAEAFHATFKDRPIWVHVNDTTHRVEIVGIEPSGLLRAWRLNDEGMPTERLHFGLDEIASVTLDWAD